MVDGLEASFRHWWGNCQASPNQLASSRSELSNILFTSTVLWDLKLSDHNVAKTFAVADGLDCKLDHSKIPVIHLHQKNTHTPCYADHQMKIPFVPPSLSS
jgi:hypothetical protein